MSPGFVEVHLTGALKDRSGREFGKAAGNVGWHCMILDPKLPQPWAGPPSHGRALGFIDTKLKTEIFIFTHGEWFEKKVEGKITATSSTICKTLVLIWNLWQLNDDFFQVLGSARLPLD